MQVLRKPLNYMLLNLSVADILNATIGGAISTAANAAGKFYLGKIWCNTYAFLVGTFGEFAVIIVFKQSDTGHGI